MKLPEIRGARGDQRRRQATVLLAGRIQYPTQTTRLKLKLTLEVPYIRGIKQEIKGADSGQQKTIADLHLASGGFPY